MIDDEQSLEDLKESFDYNDRDGDGKIDLDEFASMLDELDAEVNKDEARIGFKAIDSDRDGAIEFDEFVDWWNDR
ncbi:MAG TPA: EF-hand domain-containing protein [Gammaproteobacteria bacterium]|nr:EF-hand domain-containing protein [Gammaproteobacteria bacterium]